MIVRFIQRYLDPSDTLLEVLFGLIMALTITVGARLLSERADIVGVELAPAAARFYLYNVRRPSRLDSSGGLRFDDWRLGTTGVC